MLLARGAFLSLTVLALSARAADLASTTLLLDGVVAGPATIVVGERGTILRSPDAGASWQPARVPATATLTGVSFADPAHGWAVGHDALILATADGGATWARQWQGENLSDSFLDVLALDSRHVIAIGAYGLCVVSEDSGRTWARRKITSDDYHLNRITRGPTGRLYIAGEHGMLLRSGDRGAHWSSIPTAYDGSFYGILPVTDRVLLAYGLRGRLFRSTDDGDNWTNVVVNTTALLATAIRLRDGTIVIGGQPRGLFVSRDDGESFGSADPGFSSGIAELIVEPDERLLALGEAGARFIASPLAPTRARRP